VTSNVRVLPSTFLVWTPVEGPPPVPDPEISTNIVSSVVVNAHEFYKWNAMRKNKPNNKVLKIRKNPGEKKLKNNRRRELTREKEELRDRNKQKRRIR
jgi:hypothetical protein